MVIVFKAGCRSTSVLFSKINTLPLKLSVFLLVSVIVELIREDINLPCLKDVSIASVPTYGINRGLFEI